MRSTPDFFRRFIDCAVRRELVDSEGLLDALEYLDGIPGVIEDGLYISAFEEIGRLIARGSNGDVLKAFQIIEEEFPMCPDDLFYFYEAALDEIFSNSREQFLIDYVPKKYRHYLVKRFGDSKG